LIDILLFATSRFVLCISTTGNFMLTTDAVRSAAPQTGLSEMLVPKLISEQARQSRNRIALATDADELSYGELEDGAAQLANHLRSLGAEHETLVGLCLERSPQFVIAALAIMKCGAAYLPLDSAHPTERLCSIIKDASARLLVTDKAFADRFVDLGVGVIDLDAEKNAISAQPTKAPTEELELDHLAYVIYTSGSTGEPKGVEVTHRNLSNLVAWHVRAFALGESARATVQAGVGFDAAVWEIWPHLAIGAAIHLPNESTRLSADALRDWLVDRHITISFVSTAIAEQLIELPWPKETALQFLLTGADTLHRYPPPDLPFALVNNYGPTECTVVATSGVIQADANREMLPSIGFPIDNVHIHICGDQLREVPDGAIGEIVIGGA
jgi:amino acid adenylation domain-containing protein